MMVKICGIMNCEDATAAADAGASALGFNFYPKSPRYIGAADARTIAASLPSHILRVGVFVNATPEDAAQYDFLDIIQLHGDEPASAMAAYGKPVWKAFRVNSDWKPNVLADFKVDAVLLDGPLPGTGQAFDWTLAKGLTQRTILAGGLDETNVADAIRAVKPWGVDACSRLETQPGRKDREKMKRFVRAALSQNI